MFELSNAKVKLASVNARAEIHGEDRRPAFDLKIEVNMQNAILINFHPQLRDMLFKKSESPDLVEQLDPEVPTELRFPKLGTLKWEAELTGYTIEVDHGLGGDSNIKLGDVKLDNFKFSPMNGGSVGIEFRAICHPKTEEVGKLCEYIQREIEINVTGPEPTKPDDLFVPQEEAVA